MFVLLHFSPQLDWDNKARYAGMTPEEALANVPLERELYNRILGR